MLHSGFGGKDSQELNSKKIRSHKMMRLRTFIPSTHEGRIRLSQIGPCFSRRRGSHSQICLVELIDPATAGQRLSITPATLEHLAKTSMIPHYHIAGEIRFDPNDLNTWVHRHKIDELGAVPIDDEDWIDWGRGEGL
jgi:hypothetical protein